MAAEGEAPPPRQEFESTIPTVAPVDDPWIALAAAPYNPPAPTVDPTEILGRFPKRSSGTDSTSGGGVDDSADSSGEAPAAEGNAPASSDSAAAATAATETTTQNPDGTTNYRGLEDSTLEDMLPVVDIVFPKIDSNGNGHLTDEEVTAAVLNPDIKGQEAVLVAMLREHLPAMEGHDPNAGSADGATVQDIKLSIFERVAAESDVANAFRVQLFGEKNFGSLDADGDGYASQAEVAAAAEKASGLDRERLRLTLGRYGDIVQADDEWGSDTQITEEDFEAYGEYVMDRNDTDLEGLSETWFTAKEALYSKVDALFADQNNPLASINPDSITQNNMVDCYFVAGLSSIAGSDVGKQTIRDMIQDNGINEDGDRTFTVTFPGDPDNPVTLTEPTDSEIALFSKASEDGYWGALLEKAYSTKINNGKFSPYDLPQDSVGGSVTAAGIGILDADGGDTDLMLSHSTATLEKLISDSLRGGHPLTVSAYREPFGDGLTDTYGLERNHSFGIIGYDASTQTVTLRNPWGHGEPMTDGVPTDGVYDGIFNLTLQQVLDEFSDIRHGDF